MEQVGHLTDLEPLWLGRLDDFQSGLEVLHAVDLENRATWDADHNSCTVEAHLSDFRSLRQELVARATSMASERPLVWALHPRFKQPMTVVDLAFFVAEHDDHHLAAITELIGRFSPGAAV